MAVPVQMLFVSFNFNTSPEEYLRAMQPLTGEMLSAQGFRWKIWLINETQGIAGGLYLFDDSASVQAFLSAPLMDGMRHHRLLKDLRVMSFDILEAQTRTTHGPLGAGVRA